MRAVSRLSINALTGRRSRTSLLGVAVALSTALVVAISCALASLNAGMQQRLASSVGVADLEARHVTGERMPAGVFDLLAARDDTLVAAPRSREAVFLSASEVEDRTDRTLASLDGIVPEAEERIVTIEPDVGRAARADDEIVLDSATAEGLGVGVGGRVFAGEGGRRRAMTVVGLLTPKTIEIVNKAGGVVTLDALRALTGRDGTLHAVRVVLRDGVDAEAAADRYVVGLPRSVMVRPSSLVTSGIDRRVNANRMIFLLVTVMAFIASAFIVLTGLTTGVIERQRELAMMRCVGATRLQLALAQLGVGVGIGALGAALGAPLGVFLAWLMTVLFPERLPAGLYVSWVGLGAAGMAAVVSGLLGAMWPAATAARARPLHAMRARARGARRSLMWLVTGGALAGVGTHALIVATATDPDRYFLIYMTVGLPCLFFGYFLLGVPLVSLLARAAGPALSAALRLPRNLVGGAVALTPYRNGFTAGALMIGLAMMTSIWTNGGAVLRDWLGTIRFPDAFANGLLVGLTPEIQRRVDALEIVDATCAITVLPVEGDRGFGVRNFRPEGTTFIAFEVEPFFEMTRLHWARGDRESALPKLLSGEGVLVAQEFVVEREGYEVGSTFPITHRGRTREFEIVGAVSSPGLDVIKRYFDFEEEYAEQAIHAVFGSRDVLRGFFGTDSISLIQISLTGDATDEEATEIIREAVDTPGVVVGSGREIKENIAKIGRGSMRVASIVAFGAMLIGVAGVASVVVAGLDARRYEFGVLRSVGAGRGLLARMLLGEAVLVALTACVLGTLMGVQGSWAGLRLVKLAAGLELSLRPPALPIAAGWGLLLAVTLAAIAPVVFRIASARPRELLATTRG